MELKQLLNDDRGVSPVIGVILMVAITVILAAVIGTFVLGLGSQVGNNAPQATFEYDYSGTFDGDPADATINITHQSGQSIDPASLSVSVGSVSISDVSSGSSVDVVDNGWSDPVQAGSTLDLAETTSTAGTFGADEKVSIIWQSDGGQSSIISSSTTPTN